MASSIPGLPGPSKAENTSARQTLGNPVSQADTAAPGLPGPGKAANLTARQTLGNLAPDTQASSAPGLLGPGMAMILTRARQTIQRQATHYVT